MLGDDPKELKRRELLDKCFELFVRKGLENTSLNELAAYCNMHKATFYSYLNSKDEIVVESAKQYMEKVDKMFFELFENPQKTLKEALQHGFEVIAREKISLSTSIRLSQVLNMVKKVGTNLRRFI